MRIDETLQDDVVGYGLLRYRVPEDHPLRPIRSVVNEALARAGDRFDGIGNEAAGSSLLSPERLVRAILLQMLYSVRNERMLMEQLEYNLLFRWFVGLSANEPVWHPVVFTTYRDRLLQGAIAEEVFSYIVAQARRRKLFSHAHFIVDGTLIAAWTRQKNFLRKRQQHTGPPGSVAHVTNLTSGAVVEGHK